MGRTGAALDDFDAILELNPSFAKVRFIELLDLYWVADAMSCLIRCCSDRLTSRRPKSRSRRARSRPPGRASKLT
jgi:hypothetical protein